MIVPAVFLPSVVGWTSVENATTAAAAAMAPPIQILRLLEKPLFCSLMIALLKNAHGWKKLGVSVLCPGPVPLIWFVSGPITPRRGKSWSECRPGSGICG